MKAKIIIIYLIISTNSFPFVGIKIFSVPFMTLRQVSVRIGVFTAGHIKANALTHSG